MITRLKMTIAMVITICLSLCAHYDAFSRGEVNYPEMADFLHRQMIDYTSRNHIPNAVVAMVSADRMYLLQGYGHADPDKMVPVNPDRHLFRTGSVSKIFTWIAIMQLYERGLVDLDVDISEYLGVVFNHKVLCPKAKNTPITLRHLLTHTAGYEDVLEGLFSFNPQPSLEEQLLRNVPARIYPPGTVMAYSNWGTTLAGYIVENVSGMRFEEYVKQHIFRPMGMCGSSFEQPLDRKHKQRMVTASRWVNGEFYVGNFEHMPAPAGGLSTNAFDMALLLQAHLNGGRNAFGRILEETTMNMMHTQQFTYHPLLAGMTHGLIESYVNGYRVVSHGGSSTIFDSGFYLIPELGLGFFFAYSGGDWSGHAHILHNFVSKFFPTKEIRYKDHNPLMEVSLADLQGEYHQSRSMRTSSDRILNLMIGSLHLKTAGDKELSFNLYGMDYSYNEVKPGMYKSNKVNKDYPFGFIEYLLVTKAPDGRLMLVTDGPMTFIKTRWYERTLTAGLVFIPALFLALMSLLFFGFRAIFRRFKKRLSPFKGSLLWGNRLIIAHAATLLFTIILFMANSEPNPAHRLPDSFFNPNPVLDTIIGTGMILVGILSALLLVSTVRVWLKGDRLPLLKVYQSLYAIVALGVFGLFYLYNFLNP
jgi:CubicO group peptidase (beta-lactamase class C family)